MQKRNFKYEEYLLDNIWKNKKFVDNYNIIAIKLKDDLVYYTMSNLSINTKSLVPEEKVCTGEDGIILYSNSDYNLVKYFFIRLINDSNVNSENISNLETLNKFLNIWSIINNE